MKFTIPHIAIGPTGPIDTTLMSKPVEDAINLLSTEVLVLSSTSKDELLEYLTDPSYMVREVAQLRWTELNNRENLTTILQDVLIQLRSLKIEAQRK